MEFIAAERGIGEVLGWRLLTSLPVILVIAWIAGRLLGVRLSAIGSIVTGLAGWIAGTSLSLVLADGDPDAAGFDRNLYVFSVLFTMSAIVWAEMLAKPGTLARAQTGLGSIPRPLRNARQRAQRVRRYMQITRIAATHGLGPYLGLGRQGTDDAVDGAPPTARRLRQALEECGGMFVKMGQILSTRSDLIPSAVVKELSGLQDHVPPVHPAAIRDVLEEELGRPVEDLFSEFEWEPLAAASIGQAHYARSRDGHEVIVKVQRPRIAESVERDILVLMELARAVEARTSWGADYRVIELTREFSDGLREELDFRVEARNISAIAANISDFSDVQLPRVFPELSTSRVLTMEWLDGVSARDGEAVDALGVDRHKIADVVLRVFLKQMLTDGYFHADPHPGNILILEGGRIGLIDFGATGRLDSVEQASLTEMMIAIKQRDAALLRRALSEISSFRDRIDDDQLERALARFMTRHLGAEAVPSAAMLNELLQLLFTFGITVPPEFSTLFRALVTLEGTLRTISPGYLVIDAAQELAAEWARERMTPATLDEAVRGEVISLLPMLRKVPHRLDRIANALERGDLRLRVSLLSDEGDATIVTKLLNRAIFAFLGGTVGVLSAILLGIEGGPPFTGNTSLFQFFGYFGLFCSSVLILRVIVAVLRDRVN
jgi:ubiquinone biosynthesis protein